MRRFWILVTLTLAGCGPDEDVELLALPPLERPTPEARLGLPEVSGIWRFAGWEVLSTDTLSLERDFPTLGELRIETQRLDSLAGTFALGGGAVPVVGDVRRDGHIALVTAAGGVASGYLAGEFTSDTLWVELSSVLPPDAWPSRSRAAFVRGPIAQPMEIAWLSRARVPAPPPPVAAAPPGAGMPGGAFTPGGQPGQPGASAGQAPRPSGQPAGGARPAGGPVGAPGGGGAPGVGAGSQPPQQPPAGQQGPTPPAGGPAPAPTQTPPPQQPPAEPPAQPAPAPEPAPEDQNAPLLGDPVNQ